MRFREEIGESLTLKFALAAAERKRNGQKIISLGLGEPDFKVPSPIINATIKVLEYNNSGYSDSMGILSLREKIANQLKERNGINSEASNILITAGAKQAFQLACMAILEPGDEVVVLNPSFVSFIPQILIAEPEAVIKTIDVSKTDFSLDLEEIKNIVGLRTKLLIINSPNNPAGYVSSQSELEQLYQLAIDNDFYIISDEIYERLMFLNKPHFSIGSLEAVPERVITINGFSKSHAMTGWRLGYACFPRQLHSKLIKLQQHMNTNTCTFIQQAVAESFGFDDSYLTAYNVKLKGRCDGVISAFSNMAKVKLVAPSAGFFAFLNISATGLDSNTFCSRLIHETGVATTPGIAFGKNWDDHVRISFATSDDILKEGLELMCSFINNI
jgi:aspartate aminotransferase